MGYNKFKSYPKYIHPSHQPTHNMCVCVIKVFGHCHGPRNSCEGRHSDGSNNYLLYNTNTQFVIFKEENFSTLYYDIIPVAKVFTQKLQLYSEKILVKANMHFIINTYAAFSYEILPWLCFSTCQV